jgi:hypothetical protein
LEYYNTLQELTKWKKKKKENYNEMIYPKLQVDLHEILDQDDLALHLDHLQVPCTQTKHNKCYAKWQLGRLAKESKM